MLIIALFPIYFNRAKPIIGNPFYIRRQLTFSPKGELDNTIINSNPNYYNKEVEYELH